MSKKFIQKLVLKNQTSDAIDLLIDLAPKYSTDSSTENILMNLSSQFYGNESANKIGRISPENYNVAKSRITSYVLEILDDSFKEIGDADIPEKYRASLEEEPTAPAGNDEEGGNGSEAETAESNVVLFLSANPSQTALLKLEKEHSNIAIELQNTEIKVISAPAISFSEFSKAIYDNNPRVVHFSGHGDLKAPEVVEAYRTRGIVGKQDAEKEKKPKKEEPGIILFDNAKRNPVFVKSSILKRTFKTMIKRQSIPIEVVIFNACHSEEQARAISEVGVSVIGTSHEIQDEAALAFSSGFYAAFSRGENIEDSLDWAINQVLIFDEPEDRFRLYRDGERIEF